jgi:hypothetical protein
LIASITARRERHVRSPIVSIEGQQWPWSLALSASEISTAFGEGGIFKGQHWLMIIVLNARLPFRDR